MTISKKLEKTLGFIELILFWGMLIIAASAIGIILLSLPANAAPTTPNSFHFQAVIGGTQLCNATTSASYSQLAAGAAANAPDAIVRNTGSQIGYYEISSGGASATAAIVPTNSTGGSQAINPGEADLISKAQADTISCITATGTAALSITPGTGN